MGGAGRSLLPEIIARAMADEEEMEVGERGESEGEEESEDGETSCGRKHSCYRF